MRNWLFLVFLLPLGAYGQTESSDVSGDEEVLEEIEEPSAPKQKAKSSLAFLRTQPEKDVVRHLRNSYKGTIIGNWFDKYPKLELFVVRALLDEKALPALFRMATERKRLLIFAIINIAIIVVSFLWRRSIKRNPSLKFWPRFKQQLARIALVKAAQLGFFIHYWNAELAPAWRVEAFKVTFFN